MTISVKCPVCSKNLPWDETERHKPFCSDRCKLIDLGEWASEKHAIPGEQVSLPNDQDNY